MRCRVCNSENLEIFLDLGNQPHCDNFVLFDQVGKEPKYPLQTCFCHNCTTVQINYTIPKEVMFREFLYLSGTTKTLKEHFKESANRLTEILYLKPNDLIVDIGSNDGTWLSYYKKEFRKLGIDPAKNIAKLANESGIETWDEFFNSEIADKIINVKGKAKLITAAGVFFHLEELHSVTEGIKKLLDDDGTFCIQAIYLGSIIKYTSFDQIYHEHLTYWTVRSLQKLLSQYKLEIYDVRLIPIHGGSLEVLVCHEGKKPINSSVNNFLYDETCLGLDKIETYYEFANRVWDTKEKLLRILRCYKRCEKSIGAYGAPAKGSTLLNAFKIDNSLVSFAAEINPLKIGRYIPGTGIPILNENEIVHPDVYLVLAWNFLEEFLKKKSNFLKRGGEFIIPIYEPFVIDKSNWTIFVK